MQNNLQTHTSMKNVILISTAVFMALAFTSCSSKIEEKATTAVESVEIAPIYHPSGLDSLHVSEITNPETAKSVWLGDTGKISTIAYAKYVELMREVIKNTTDVKQAEHLWLYESGEVSTLAYAKYVELMREVIKNTTDVKQAEHLWLYESGEVSTLAYAKYVELGGK
jgi:hypothetical protein